MTAIPQISFHPFESVEPKRFKRSQVLPTPSMVQLSAIVSELYTPFLMHTWEEFVYPNIGFFFRPNRQNLNSIIWLRAL